MSPLAALQTLMKGAVAPGDRLTALGGGELTFVPRAERLADIR